MPSIGHYINLFPFTRKLLNVMGPAVWRLPRDIRSRLCQQSKLSTLQGISTFLYGKTEHVKPIRPSGHPASFGHRIAGRPYFVPTPKVTQLEKCWLVGQHATPVTLNGDILLSSFRDQVKLMTLEPNEDLINWVRAKQYLIQLPEPDLQNVCSLVNRLDPNYYHWIVEWCGQVEGILEYETQSGVRPRLLIRAGGPTYLRSSLELLGIAPDSIIEWNPDQDAALVENLVIPSVPGIRVAASPRNLKWLRNRFLEAAGVDQSNLRAERRLYISRKKGGWRSILNEEEVAAYLEEEGFEPVRAESLSLVEQIRLFSTAKIIVGLHGAGLTNILFAPQATLVEFLGSYGGGEYYNLATVLGQDYHSLCCESRGDDILVNIDDLKAILQSIKCGNSR